MNTFTNRIRYSPYIWLIIAAIIGASLILFFLITALSTKLEENEIAWLQDQFTKNTSLITTLETKANNSMPWFVTSYQKPVMDAVASAKESLKPVPSFIDQAKKLKGNELYAVTGKARAALTAASAATTSGNAAVDDAINLRQAARTKFDSVSPDEDRQAGGYSNAKNRLASETQDQLSKYTDPLAEMLIQGSEKIGSIRSALKAALAALPPNESKNGSGDPKAAIDYTTVAEKHLADLKTMTASVVTGLNMLASAKENAGPTNEVAAKKLSDALAYIEDTAEMKHFHKTMGLKEAVLLQAQGLLYHIESAIILINRNALGQVDWPEAYKRAQVAVSLAEQSTASVTAQIDAWQYAREKFPAFDTTVTDTEKRIDAGVTAQNVLIQYHARDTWSGVANNLATAVDNVNRAKTQISDARKAFADERFVETRTLIDNVFTDLSQAQTLSQNVITKKDELESYRSDWFWVKRDSQQAIHDGPGYLSTTDWHNQLARRDFDQAKDDVESAISKANAGYYEEALSLAKRAAEEAREATRREKQKKADDEEEEKHATATARAKR
jgi:hypothetical protein